VDLDPVGAPQPGAGRRKATYRAARTPRRTLENQAGNPWTLLARGRDPITGCRLVLVVVFVPVDDVHGGFLGTGCISGGPKVGGDRL